MVVAPLLFTLAVAVVLLAKLISSKSPVPPSLIWVVVAGPLTMLTVVAASWCLEDECGDGTVSVTGERFMKAIGTLLWLESV